MKSPARESTCPRRVKGCRRRETARTDMCGNLDVFLDGRRSSIATLWCEKGSQESDFFCSMLSFNSSKGHTNQHALFNWFHDDLNSLFKWCFVFNCSTMLCLHTTSFFCTIPIHRDYSFDFFEILINQAVATCFPGGCEIKHLRIRRIRRMFQVVIRLMHCGTSILTCCFFFQVENGETQITYLDPL